ncbi:hypothetical protein V499_02540 [Pseudogymnoascus sp. VKM F-103]|nr:hypothetical protein V499_02540 [Pseudogymnoascus sp. VKM F-103]
MISTVSGEGGGVRVILAVVVVVIVVALLTAVVLPRHHPPTIASTLSPSPSTFPDPKPPLPPLKHELTMIR